MLPYFTRIFFFFLLTIFSLTSASHWKRSNVAAVGPGEHGDVIELKTGSGWVRGKLYSVGASVGARQVVSFLGVPYAKPPTGDGRFSSPEPNEQWTGTRDALKPGYDCYSLRDDAFPGFRGSETWNAKMEFSEDCLNLNIWAPRHAANATVMVWIFGGGFYSGSPSLDLYDGSVMAAQSNVVVVAVNYRLGPFGFLNLGDETANAGLLDQQMALRWVNRNVHYFGGDPNRVTLFGESAGSVGVNGHLLAPDSWPLFRYAILQSGSIICPWATKTVNQSRENAHQLLDLLGCSNGSDSERVQCARRIDARDLLTAYHRLSAQATFMEYQFVPLSIDSKFFRGNVHENLAAGRFKKTAVIVGTNADEGTYWLPYFLPAYFNNQSEGLINWYEYRNSVEKAYSTYYHHPAVIRKAIAYHYLWSTFTNEQSNPWQPSKQLYRSAISKTLGDYFFTCPTLNFADYLSQNGAVVYTYYFNERSSANPWPQWMGVMHGYEIEYIFGVPLRKPESYTMEEVEFSRRMVDYWTSFAKHGAPALQHLQKERAAHPQSTAPVWPVYGQSREFVILQSARTNPPPSWIGRRLDNDDCGFWRDTQRVCQENDWGNDGSQAGYVSAGSQLRSDSKTLLCSILAIALLQYVFGQSMR